MYFVCEDTEAFFFCAKGRERNNIEVCNTFEKKNSSLFFFFCGEKIA